MKKKHLGQCRQSGMTEIKLEQENGHFTKSADYFLAFNTSNTGPKD
jgi:hypothetical protein